MSLLNKRIVIIIINYFFLYSMLSTLKLDDVLTTFEKGGKKDLAEDRKTTNFPTTCFHKFPLFHPIIPPSTSRPSHTLTYLLVKAFLVSSSFLPPCIDVSLSFYFPPFQICTLSFNQIFIVQDTSVHFDPPSL